MLRPSFRAFCRVSFVLLICAAGAVPLVPKVDGAPVTTRPATKPSGPEVYLDMRNSLLATNPKEAGSVATHFTLTSEVWCVLAEFTSDDTPVTIVGCQDGSASIYLGNGGGYIGGSQHDACRQAARRMCAAGDATIPKAERVHEYPVAKPGPWQFYILTKNGNFRVTAPRKDLEDPKHPLHPMFDAAEDVMTAFFKLEKEQPEKTQK